MRRLNTRRTPRQEKALDALVAEAFNHKTQCIVYRYMCQATVELFDGRAESKWRRARFHVFLHGGADEGRHP